MTADLRPAPKHLAMLASEMRADWTYDDTRAALIACSEAHWPDDRIYRETFRLLLLDDSSPADLRQAARDPRVPVPAAGEETFQAGLAKLREAFDNRVPRLHDSEAAEAGDVE